MHTQSDSSAVGSALRSGRRGRAFESPLSDMGTEYRRPIIRIALLIGAWCCGFLFYILAGQSISDLVFDEWLQCRLVHWGDSASSFLLERLKNTDLSHEAKAQVAALTLGHKEMLTPEIKIMYRSAGASHILALSGMHLGILYGLFSVVIRNSINSIYKWITIPVVLTSVWSYALLTGTPYSLLRAALMVSIALLIEAGGRRCQGMDILTTSMSVVFLLNPATAFDCGFQLSCAAMTGILVLGVPFIKNMKMSYRLPRNIIGSLSVSFAAQLCTTPLTLWYFGSFATYSWLTSLISIPMTLATIYLSIGMYCGLWGCTTLIEHLICIQNTIMTYIGRLPFAYIEI